MWSRNGSPVATTTRPRPPSPTFAVSRVSLLLRVTAPFLFKANLHRVGVRPQAFELGQPHRRPSQHLEVVAIQLQHARALEKRLHPQGQGVPPAPGGGHSGVRPAVKAPKRNVAVGPTEPAPAVLPV